MNNKKGFAFVVLLLFTIISFTLVFVERADARAGGGHRFSGSSSRSSSSRSYRSSSHRSSSHSRPLTEAEKKAMKEFYKNHWHIFLMLILLHILSWLALYRRIGFNDDPSEESHKVWWILPLVMLITLPFSALTPLYLLLEIKFIIDDKKRGKFMSFTALELEEAAEFQKLADEARAAEEAEKLAELKSIAPDFDLEAFKARTAKAFLQIQESWCKRDLSKAERFLADGTYEQFQIQINQMKAIHEKDVMEDIKINSINLEKIESKAGFDAIYLSISATAINYQINDKTEELISGSDTRPDNFTEIWCFMRRKGAKSLNDKGLIEGFCPNCGAPLEGSRISKCQHCSAVLRSGQHDWVLTGITQLSEWRDTTSSSIPGMRTLQKEDPAFNIANLEDRLSVMFWRLNEALRIQNVDPIRKIATDSFISQFDAEKSLKDFPNTTNTAIGSIEITGICKENNNNILLGQITWSGQNFYSGTQIYRKTIFKLIRAENAVTDEKTCFCNSHCPNCGAPEIRTGSNVCEYCQTAVNDHNKEWILDAVLTADEMEAVEYMAKANKLENTTPEPEPQEVSDVDLSEIGFDLNDLDYISGTDLLRLTIAMMLADSVIDQSEMNIINKICEMKEISNDKLQSYISELRSLSDPVQYALDTTAIKLDEKVLILLIIIATADGNIANEEAAMLQKLADRMGVPQSILNRTINTVLENQN